jgi:hypothetical protein
MENFTKLYLIELECIDEGNSFGLNLGEKVYAAGWDGSDYAHDVNNAGQSSDIEYTKEIAKRIYDEGNFMPRIKEIVRYVGNEISVNF